MRRRRRRSGCTTIGLIFLLPLCLIIALAGFVGWRLYTIGTSLQANQEKLQMLVDSAETLPEIDPVQLDGIIRETRDDVVELNSIARPFLFITPYLDFIPRIGPLLVDAEHYLDLADAATHAASAMRPTVQTALATAQLDRLYTDNQIAYLLKLLEDAEPNLHLIEDDVKQIKNAYAQLESKEQLPWAARKFVPLADEFMPLADEAIALMQVLPRLTSGDKFYQIWIQNNDELRATGGYISGFGTLAINDGDISDFEFISTNDVNRNILDHLDQLAYPPQPMLQYMGLEYWVTADANFYPDFPTSAEQALNIYRIQQPNSPPVDGVIAIDQQFVKMLLEVLGPIYVPELEREVNSSNIIEVMRDAFTNPAIEDEGEAAQWFENRKRFIGQIAEALQDKLISNPASLDVTGFSRMLLEAIEQRHLQIYVVDPAGKQTLSELEWDGGMQIRPNQDFLAVINSNFGYNKVTAVVEQTIAYRVQLNTNGNNRAQVDINYHHTGAPSDQPCTQTLPTYHENFEYEEMFDRCYYNYVRVYPPFESQLSAASTHPIPGDYVLSGQPHDGVAKAISDPLDFPGFENFVVVPKGQNATVSFEYQLPPTIVQQLPDGTLQYTLTSRKQSGMQPSTQTTQVTLPTTAIFLTATPTPLVVDGQSIIFQTELDRDQTITINFRLP